MSRDGRFNWRLVEFDEQANTSTWRSDDSKYITLRGEDIHEPESVSFTIHRNDLATEARRISQEMNVSEPDALTALMTWIDYALDELIEDAASWSAKIARKRLLLPEEVFDDEEEETEIRPDDAPATAAVLLQDAG